MKPSKHNFMYNFTFAQKQVPFEYLYDTYDGIALHSDFVFLRDAMICVCSNVLNLIDQEEYRIYHDYMTRSISIR